MSFKILIVEDELIIAEMIKEMLAELNYHVLGVAKNYHEAIKLLESANDIQLVILDINLNDHKSGIEIGELIKNKYKIPFIYLTSYSDPRTIQKAAQTTPSAYLLKPFTKGDLHATIEIIKSRETETSQSILIKENDLQFKVDLKDIRYIKSDNNYLEIYTSDKKHLIRHSLDGFLEELDCDTFIRVHRSYVVNFHRIQVFNGQFIMLNNDKIPISRKYKIDLLKKLEES